ncbi:glycosyltransferase family 2 protein [Acidithiobacillus thiooxidans]|uniref:glycosyltransferase n=1 Tax=Acidithiobacillus thiooxidans TaxID=930 RepID=UPI001C077D70|nr:glycosyltransferase [Acidithiobacillus thiooxidans]MBU2838970.1 glycosyltransferase family 2 protein [Acidithiobacillus thiooxidans]
MRINVLINGGNRPRDMERMLSALMAQTRKLDALFILIHPRETETADLLKNILGSAIPYTLIYKDQSGPIAAMLKTLHLMSCDVVAFTHDDAAPRPDWLARIESLFACMPEMAGVGGRDLPVSSNFENTPYCDVMGRVTWYGKIYANHHLPCSSARKVDFLSGVNAAYRHDILMATGLNQRLQWQQDTVWFWELALGMALKKQGFKQWYDPDMVVEHFPGKLFSDQKDGYWSASTRKRAQKETYILLKYLSVFGRFACMVYILMVGSRDSYGLLQVMRYLPREWSLTFRKILDALRGRYNGMQTWMFPDNPIPHQRIKE